MSERHGTRIDGELGSVENNEPGIGDDIEVDGDGAAEFASGEVWFEPYVVAFWHGELRKPSLAFELLHLRRRLWISNDNEIG